MSKPVSAPLRLLEMVSELHERGYERLRITPSMSPSGMSWRLTIKAPDSIDTARYTTGGGEETVFGWSGSASMDGPALADLFIERFAVLVAAARGADPHYAGWFQRVLDLARQGWFPYYFADWPTPKDGNVPLLSTNPGPAEEKPVLPDPPGGR